MGYILNDSNKQYANTLPSHQRGKCIPLSLRDRKTFVENVKFHDANFAFLSTELAKVYQKVAEPLWYTTYGKDVDIENGGGFVDYVEYYTISWAGLTADLANLVGNNGNIVPRVNAGLNQKRVPVFTWEVAYDLRFIELEKMKKVDLLKSIQEIYSNIITAGWDLFAQKVTYTGIGTSKGLFNSTNVQSHTVDNSGTTGKGFEGLTDAAVVSFFNGIFQATLVKSGMNPALMPDRILVPTFVQQDLISRFSALYTSTLLQFLVDHNLGKAQNQSLKLTIEARPDLDTLGAAGKGRIVAYPKKKEFVRINMPYPMQHFVTLPNIERMSYTSIFVGQVSEIQMPYNTSSDETGPISYWDFTD